MVRWALAWHVLVLLGLLDSCKGLLIPRTSFAIGTSGRSVIRFTTPGVENSTTLLLSDDGATLYVGARDAVLSLDVSKSGIMEIKRQIDWSPEKNELQDCTDKGKSKMDCHNFVRVLQFLNTTHIYACGTFAYNPTCNFINTETFTLLSNSKETQEDSRGRCPFNPHQRSTAIAVDGELYTGTVSNFLGDQPVISRFLSERSRGDLKLDDQQGWLSEPTFVSSTFVPSEGKVYYFFRETGMEYAFINDYTVSRVGQVCTSDVGGKLTLQKRWTTFAKAQLFCQADTDLPFNIIQDMVTLPPPEGAPPDDTLFYGIFSSQWPVASGQSAVCKFRLGDIKRVFAGNYKTLNRGTLHWDSAHKAKVASPGQCGLHDASDAKLRFVKENFLAEGRVRPADQGLSLVSPDQLYSRIVAQRTRAASGRDFTVLFLLTESGFLHKTVLSDKGPHIIEEIQVFKQPQSVKNILLSLTKGVVFVGSSEGVFQVPVSNCSFYSTCAQCVLARDPFCGWDPNRLTCAEVTSISSGAAQDVELGNVKKACGTVPSVPPEKVMYVRMNDVVTLYRPRVASRLAVLRWEGRDGKLRADTFLQQENGNLSFLASPHTLETYHCVAAENGYEETLRIISVKQVFQVSPRSFNPNHTPIQSRPMTTQKPSLGPMKEDTEMTAEVAKAWAETGREEVTEAWAETGREKVTDVWEETEREEVWAEIQPPFLSGATNVQKDVAIATQAEDVSSTLNYENLSNRRPLIQIQSPFPSSDVKSYFSEMLVVSLLLVVSLCMLMVSVVYIYHQWSSGKTALRGYPSTDDEAVSSKECDPLSEEEPPGSLLK